MAFRVVSTLRRSYPSILQTRGLCDATKAITPTATDNRPAIVNGYTQEILATRKVRIYAPAKAPTQSGVENTGFWKIEFVHGDRWSNPLMGWTGTSDPLTNMKLQFSTKEAAIKFAEQEGYTYEPVAPPQKAKIKPKTYSDNFIWKGPQSMNGENVRNYENGNDTHMGSDKSVAY